MPSATKKTEAIRQNHHRHCGKVRRRALRLHGTTPVFPIHVEQAEKQEKEQ